MRYLMYELCTEDKLHCSLVRGKKSLYPPLDQDTMTAILYMLVVIKTNPYTHSSQSRGMESGGDRKKPG